MTQSAESNPNHTCYFMVADILGFSQMIANLSADEQSQRINEWIDIIRETKSATGVKNTQLISDTLFVKEEDSCSGLLRLLRFSRKLLSMSIQKSFPIRGAITHGEVHWGELTYGKAVIQAHEAERSLDWIGISCSPKLPRVELMWNWNTVVVYPAPKKSGLTQLGPAIAWEIPLANELFSKAIGQGLVGDGEAVQWHVVSKVERTVQFGMYLRLGKAKDLDPKTYPGWFPMHVIENLSDLGGSATQRQAGAGAKPEWMEEASRGPAPWAPHDSP